MSRQDDRDAIDGLFDRIEAIARESAPRDKDAEAAIQQRLRDYPPAPYYMAQTIIVQQEALRRAQERIEELEAGQNRSRGGGFLGGLFGDDEPPRRGVRQPGPWDQRPESGSNRGQSGGFLGGAAQTAIGVTGGLLLGSAIMGMFSGEAQAQETDVSADEGGDELDAGGDDFDGGDFDMGGDF